MRRRFIPANRIKLGAKVQQPIVLLAVHLCPNLALFAATAPNHTEPPTNSVSATFDPFAPVFPAIQSPAAQAEALKIEILTMEGPPP